jgi:hypothetical protein
MRLGGHKAVLVRAIALAASSSEPLASSKIKFLMDEPVGTYLMLEVTSLIHHAEKHLTASFRLAASD